MDWIDAIKPLTQSGVGVYLFGVLVLVFGTTAIFSEETAKKKFWAIGAAARWWVARKEAAADYEESIFTRKVDLLSDEIARVDAQRQRDREYFESEIARFEASEKRQHKYIVWVTNVFRNIEVWAANRGYELPPPPFKTYLEWVEEYEK